MFAEKIRTGLWRVRHGRVIHVVPGRNGCDAICNVLQVLL